MNRWLPTVPPKSSIFTLYRSLLRQARLLPHEYLRYFLTVPAPPCGSLIYDRHFFRLKLSADIKSALDGTRKHRQRQATFKRLQKVTKLSLASPASNFSVGTLQAKPRQ